VFDQLFGPDKRAALLRLLAIERLGDLRVAERAALVAALQRGRTGALAERAVRDVCLGTRGADLTQLKNALDGGGSYRDLQELLYHDIDDAGLRREILAHIAGEGAPSGEIKILS